MREREWGGGEGEGRAVNELLKLATCFALYSCCYICTAHSSA